MSTATAAPAPSGGGGGSAYTAWTITATTQNPKPRWQARIDRTSIWNLGITVNLAAPAIRLTLLGRAFIAGRVLDRPEETTRTIA